MYSIFLTIQLFWDSDDMHALILVVPINHGWMLFFNCFLYPRERVIWMRSRNSELAYWSNQWRPYLMLNCMLMEYNIFCTVYFNRELKQTTFLTTRTLTGNKLHVFNQSQVCFFTSWRPCCQKRRLLKVKLPNFTYGSIFTLVFSILTENSGKLDQVGFNPPPSPLPPPPPSLLVIIPCFLLVPLLLPAAFWCKTATPNKWSLRV